MDTLNQEEILRQISAYLAGTAQSSEIVALEQWINASGENRKYFLQLKNIWEASDKSIDFSKISTDKALPKVLRKIRDKKIALWGYWQRVAAILLLPLICYNIINNYTSKTETAWCEVSAPLAGRTSVTLPDGSVVWLNSAAVLRYPDRFEAKTRTVQLSGEAYFEVESNPKRPFVVKTSWVDVVATGTKFNVQAVESRGVAEVTLETGRVNVNRTSKSGAVEILAALQPNQRLVYNKKSGTAEVKNENAYKYLAWKDGKLIFRNDSLKTVVEKLSYVYDVEIELVGNGIQDYCYRATFENESIDEVLKLLKLTSPIDYKEVKREKKPDNTFPKRKFILFPAKMKM